MCLYAYNISIIHVYKSLNGFILSNDNTMQFTVDLAKLHNSSSPVNLN